MADRYEIGTGVWNATSSWSTSSGGSTGASVPVDGDDVYFDGNSGTITIKDPLVITSGSAGLTNTLNTGATR